MSTNNTVPSHYFSGQGVVMLASKLASGKPGRLRPVGNVSDLKITAAATVVNHKESQTGQRGTDLRLQTGVEGGLSMTMENFDRYNLAQALRGNITPVAGATIVAEAINVYPGAVSAAAHINISAVAVKQGLTTLTAYVNDTTPYDYRPYTDGGSFAWNDGSTIAWAGLGVAASAIAVGATTQITLAATANAVVGGLIYVRGYTGADAAAINGHSYTITAVDATHITFAFNSASLTLVATGSKNVWDGQAATVDYTYSDQVVVDALTQGISDIWMRFEGLNTAEDNKPVIIEVFRFSTDPLKELAMISDTIANFVLEGSVLLDAQQLASTGSPYFRVTTLD